MEIFYPKSITNIHDSVLNIEGGYISIMIVYTTVNDLKNQLAARKKEKTYWF